MRQRWPVDRVLEIDGAVLRRDFGDHVAGKSLLEWPSEVPPCLCDEGDDARGDNPGGPSSPLEEFNGSRSRSKAEKRDHLPRLTPHDDEDVEDGGGTSECQIDEHRGEHPRGGRVPAS